MACNVCGASPLQLSSLLLLPLHPDTPILHAVGTPILSIGDGTVVEVSTGQAGASSIRDALQGRLGMHYRAELMYRSAGCFSYDMVASVRHGRVYMAWSHL